MPGRFLCWCILISCCCACKNEPPYSNCITAKETVIPLTLTSKDTLHLYLDSLMVMGISTPVDYHEKENKLYVLDNYNNRLLEYSTDSTDQVNIHKINVKNKLSWFNYLSPDSLVLYSYAGAELLYYFMNSHQITQKFSFRNRSAGKYTAPPYANAACPIFLNGNAVIGFGFLIGESGQENPAARTICSVIRPDGNVQYRIPYSKAYGQHNWGGSHLRTPYTSYNEQTKQILLSLPADHNIQVIDSNWQIKEIPAATRRPVCITSMALSKDDERVSDAEYALAYFNSSASYRNIIYDHHHNRYYRILELPSAGDKAASLIVFDKDFKYLGEVPLPKALAFDNFFINKEGIYFLNTNNNNQNVAQYVQCKVNL